MNPADLSPADRARFEHLRRMKALALSLLVVAALLYLITLRTGHGGFSGWVNAGSEAAMVGALADWFAVTALFRRPLGLPIPHTAIVPTKKDEIAVSLQDFFTENFLTEEVARDRLAQAEVALRAGRWLQDADNSSRAAREIARVGAAGLARVQDADVRTLLDSVVLPRLVGEPVAALAGDMLAGVVTDGAHRGFVDMVGREVLEWLERNPDSFKKMVANRAPWWSPDAISGRVVDWTYQQALVWIGEILDDPQHPTRQSVDDLLLRIATDLQHDEGVQARAEALKTRLLTHPQVGDSAMSLWSSVRESLLASLRDPASQITSRVQAALGDTGAALVEDAGLRARVDAQLADVVVFFVNSYGSELASVISHTIERWDGDEASRRIELHVGRDLQFIRINGTVVGCLAGLLIHAVSLLVA